MVASPRGRSARETTAMPSQRKLITSIGWPPRSNAFLNCARFCSHSAGAAGRSDHPDARRAGVHVRNAVWERTPAVMPQRPERWQGASASSRRGVLGEAARRPKQRRLEDSGRRDVEASGGWPDASFILALKPGYAMGGAWSGPLLVTPNDAGNGTHGWLPGEPDMRASFLIAGNGIAKDAIWAASTCARSRPPSPGFSTSSCPPQLSRRSIFTAIAGSAPDRAVRRCSSRRAQKGVVVLDHRSERGESSVVIEAAARVSP